MVENLERSHLPEERKATAGGKRLQFLEAWRGSMEVEMTPIPEDVPPPAPVSILMSMGLRGQKRRRDGRWKYSWKEGRGWKGVGSWKEMNRSKNVLEDELLNVDGDVMMEPVANIPLSHQELPTEQPPPDGGAHGPVVMVDVTGGGHCPGEEVKGVDGRRFARPRRGYAKSRTRQNPEKGTILKYCFDNAHIRDLNEKRSLGRKRKAEAYDDKEDVCLPSDGHFMTEESGTSKLCVGGKDQMRGPKSKSLPEPKKQKRRKKKKKKKLN